MSEHEPIVLGIETSCDETGVGIVRGSTVLANVISSSMQEHAQFGGIIPEIAARAHLEAIEPTLKRALEESQLRLEQIDAIAVTRGPGLAGALMVGVGAAKALAVALKKPLYGVNHLVGHVSSATVHLPHHQKAPIQFPAIALLVSGGHTSLLRVQSLTSEIEVLGETLDDAAGEAFDKIGRLLGLPYPGGPHLDACAQDGDSNSIVFPRGLTKSSDMASHRYDFSFSGVKTAVARWIETCQRDERTIPVENIAAGFREAVIDVLVTKTLAACKAFDVSQVLLGGGVVANRLLRERMLQEAQALGIDVYIPDFSLCTDNGAMIAALGAKLIVENKAPSPISFTADSSLPVSDIYACEV